MKRLIERRLGSTTPPADPVSAALARLPHGIADAWFKQPLVPAAVLIPLVERREELTVLLTQRAEHLVDHPGQISFPGGRSEPADTGPRHTALREAKEEVGLAAESVAVIGYLEPLAVVTGFAVAPVIGFVADDVQFEIDPVEVADVFEVPLSFFMDDGNRRDVERTIDGVTMPFIEYHFENRRIWGATALMIRDLIFLIKNN